MTLPRRDFLGIAGASGLIAAAAPLHAQPFAATASFSGDGITPIAADWDMTWVDRVTGRHRAVFDSPGVSDGAAVFRANMWLNQYREVYGTERADMSPVIVLRHSGTALALNDDYWTKFDVARELAEDDAPRPAAPAPAPASPARPDSASVTPSPASPRKNPLSGTGPNSLATFLDGGGIVLVCNVAFQQAVGRFRRADRNLSRDAALELAKAHLVSRVILQPSGIFAALRAQEAGCHYILAG
jgi:hypothetical protein